MNGGFDIGKIVSLIMENPKLIEEISKLGKQDDAALEETSGGVAEHEQQAPLEATQTIAAPNESTLHAPPDKNRSRLLGALKPYVSKERAQAIDSMLSVVEILEAMKGR